MASWGPPGVPETGILTEGMGLSTDGIMFIGDAFAVATAVVPATVPDNGGIVLVATGVFPLDQTVLVQLSDGTLVRDCYSGIVGNGAACQSLDGTTLEFVLPPFPVGGPYDLILTAEGGLPVTFADAITVVHRAFSTNLFNTRAVFAAPRDVGPYSIKDSD